MMESEPAADAENGLKYRGRAVYRSSDGQLRLDWPEDRLAEALADETGTLWFDIEHVDGDLAAIESLLRDRFGFHALAIDDALHETHVPKIDDWEHYVYTVFLAIDFDPKADTLRQGNRRLPR